MPTNLTPNGFASEDAFQCAAFMWTWNTFPDQRRTFLHPANEGYKNIVKAKQDEAKGMLPGAADFIFLAPAFVIELKQPGGQQTENQKKFQAACEKNGIPYYLVRYMDDFKETVRRHLK